MTRGTSRRRRWRRIKRRWERVQTGVLLVLVGAAIVAGITVAWIQWHHDTAASLAGPAPSEPALTDRRPVLLVVGDSYVGGSLMNHGPTWPERMAAATDGRWVVVTDGVGGTGYVNGTESGTSFPQRVEKDCRSFTPDVVVVAGGINDTARYPDAEVASKARETVSGFEQCFPHARIVLFSPFAPATLGPPTDTLATALQQVADAEGIDFINVSHLLEGRTDLIGSDGVHPNDRGHAYLASEIGSDLAPILKAASR